MRRTREPSGSATITRGRARRRRGSRTPRWGSCSRRRARPSRRARPRRRRRSPCGARAGAPRAPRRRSSRHLDAERPLPDRRERHLDGQPLGRARLQPEATEARTGEHDGVHSPASTLRSRVSTLPRTGTNVTSGRASRSDTTRRRLPVPTRAPGGSAASEPWRGATRTSRGSARTGKQARTSPGGRLAGTSLTECTARSARDSSNASSISFTKSPLPPTSESGLSWMRSPVVVTSSSAVVEPRVRGRQRRDERAALRQSEGRLACRVREGGHRRGGLVGACRRKLVVSLVVGSGLCSGGRGRRSRRGLREVEEVVHGAHPVGAFRRAGCRPQARRGHVQDLVRRRIHQLPERRTVRLARGASGATRTSARAPRTAIARACARSATMAGATCSPAPRLELRELGDDDALGGLGLRLARLQPETDLLLEVVDVVDVHVVDAVNARLDVARHRDVHEEAASCPSAPSSRAGPCRASRRTSGSPCSRRRRRPG